MKKTRKIFKKTLVFVGLLLCGLNFLFAQQVPQPDFANVPAYYIEGSSELHNLAKENVNMVGKMKAAMYEAPGAKSKIRIKATDNYVLLIKAEQIDPSSVMQIKKATITKKNNRQVPMAQASGFFTQTVNTSEGAIPYNLKKLDNNVFQIVPESELEPGEYIVLMGAIAYSFAIE
jgi:hypothetical protein